MATTPSLSRQVEPALLHGHNGGGGPSPLRRGNNDESLRMVEAWQMGFVSGERRAVCERAVSSGARTSESILAAARRRRPSEAIKRRIASRARASAIALSAVAVAYLALGPSNPRSSCSPAISQQERQLSVWLGTQNMYNRRHQWAGQRQPVSSLPSWSPNACTSTVPSRKLLAFSMRAHELASEREGAAGADAGTNKVILWFNLPRDPCARAPHLC